MKKKSLKTKNQKSRMKTKALMPEIPDTECLEDSDSLFDFSEEIAD
jgi:hypothetical protein